MPGCCFLPGLLSSEPAWQSTGPGPWGLQGFWEDRDPVPELTGVGEFLKDTLGVALSLGAMGESSIVSAISREVTCNSH